MATKPRKHGDGFKVEICVKGVRESKTLPTAREANTWARERELQLQGGRLPDCTFGEALDRYDLEVAPNAGHRRGESWIKNKTKIFRGIKVNGRKLADMRLRDFDAAVLHDVFRQRRDRKKKNGDPLSLSAFRREWNQLCSVFAVCSDHGPDGWKLLYSNPCRGIKKPPNPKGRCRGVTAQEIKDICEVGLGYKRGKPTTDQHVLALMFQFSIETAMRVGEIGSIQRKDCHRTWVHLPKTKNGDERDVPLSSRAREILALMPAQVGTVFPLNLDSEPALFRKAREKCGIRNLVFHDARGEGITRMSKKLDVLELARAIGHRDLNSLLIYYQASADSLSAKLG